jgi:hypothetical protein
MTNKPFVSREDKIHIITDEAAAVGSYSDGKHRLEVVGHTIWVREEFSGKGVAYSSTKADFDQSLVEFVTDYFA